MAMQWQWKSTKTSNEGNVFIFHYIENVCEYKKTSENTLHSQFDVSVNAFQTRKKMYIYNFFLIREKKQIETVEESENIYLTNDM